MHPPKTLPVAIAADPVAVAMAILYPSDLVRTAVAVLTIAAVAQATPTFPVRVTIAPLPQTASVVLMNATMMKRLLKK